MLPTQGNSASQVFNLVQVGCRLVAHLARVGSNLAKLKRLPNSSHVFHRLANSANSRHVLLFLGNCAVVVRQSNGFLPSLVGFGSNHLATCMQLLILKLGRVWSSWEYRLARAKTSFTHATFSAMFSMRFRVRGALFPPHTCFVTNHRVDLKRNYHKFRLYM